jgi:hypothetical protein
VVAPGQRVRVRVEGRPQMRLELRHQAILDLEVDVMVFQLFLPILFAENVCSHEPMSWLS